MPVDHHFLPLMTTSSPSRIAVACMLVASLDATSGSVMQNAERISPASRGLSQRCLCSSLPYFHNTSMLPVSGASQLKTSGARKLLPISSASGAYSTWVRPAPRSEEHTYELQSLRRSSSAVFCLKKEHSYTTLHEACSVRNHT